MYEYHAFPKHSYTLTGLWYNSTRTIVINSSIVRILRRKEQELIYILDPKF